MEALGSRGDAVTVQPVGVDRTTTHPRVHAAGRECLEEGCATVLSIYNSSSRCSVHGSAPKQYRHWRRSEVPPD